MVSLSLVRLHGASNLHSIAYTAKCVLVKFCLVGCWGRGVAHSPRTNGAKQGAHQKLKRGFDGGKAGTLWFLRISQTCLEGFKPGMNTG